jgi:exopolyphosphatase / guanosine-5'-triphosphate,3'-diphosphate pyrophosphatase
MKTRYLFFIIPIAILTICGWHIFTPRPQVITRAAVDVGSGGLKVTVAKIDPISQKIHQILYSKEHPVPLKRDLQVGGKSEFSDKIQKVALETLANLQQEVSTHNPREWRGIATAASRQATNAQEMYDKIAEELGVVISIISQQEEGRLGFMTAVSVSEIDHQNLISFDSGSGSFQLSTLLDEKLHVIEGELGHIPSLEALMAIRGQKLDFQTPPAPITLDEANTLIPRLQQKLPSIPPAFAEKLKKPHVKVVGIGNENFIFAMGAKGVGKNTYTKEELYRAITVHASKPAEEMQHFSKPHEAVLGMVLLYSIMDGMGIDTITYCHANGSCEGLLVDQGYWNS